MRLTFRVTILSVVVLLSGGCKEQEPGSAVSVLLTAKVRFSDDGAGGSIPELMEQPQVKALLDRPGIWRELVNHLDSTELTGGTFQLQSGTSEEPSVPLGFYCLDILLNCVDIGHRNSVFWDYGDGGLWTNV
ncbi:MAG: hypothetical protein QGD94_09560, partial [Planctomycetia bacterium]|nr:hypothetical protein [Planctomycetia bacterium]